jgi:hypothetical protein
MATKMSYIFRLLLAYTVMLLLAFAVRIGANAQIDLPAGQAQLYPKISVSSYTGPCDVVNGSACNSTTEKSTFTAFWALRAYSGIIAAAATQPLVNLERASDSHTCDIIVATNGGLGVTGNCSTGGDDGQSAASFCNSTTCTVPEIYDQTGNGWNLTASGAAQPSFAFSCLGSFPCLKSTSITILLTAGSNFTPNAAKIASYSIVADRSSGTGSVEFLAENGGTGNRMSAPSANTWNATGGSSGSVSSTGTTAADGAWHIGLAAVAPNGSTSTLDVDGTTFTGTTVANSTTAGTPTMIRGASSTTLEMVSAGFADDATWGGTVLSNLCHNNYEYWGTPTSC